MISTAFQDLSFRDAGHEYFVGDNKIRMSVSGLVSKFKPPFNAEEISKAVGQKTGESPQEVRKKWAKISQDACTKGSSIHLFGEQYPILRNMKPSCPEEEAIVKFWNDIPDSFEIAALEYKMYHKRYLFAGTADIILRDKETGTFAILDYKTNRDLFKNFKGQRLLPPFGQLLNNPFNTYQLQLSLYQLLFEQLGLQVSMRRIIWLKPDGTYDMFDTNDFTKELDKQIPYLLQ